MKFTVSRDGVGVQTEPKDAELVKASHDIIEGIFDFADAAGVHTDGKCFRCGDEHTLRPFPVSDDNAGGFRAVDVCADCQRALVEEVKRDAAMAAADENDVPRRDGTRSLTDDAVLENLAADLDTSPEALRERYGEADAVTEGDVNPDVTHTDGLPGAPDPNPDSDEG